MSEAVTAPGGKQRLCTSCSEPLADPQTVCDKCGASNPLTSEPVTAPGPPAKPTDLGVTEVLLGQWKLESKIGEGGMGDVFLATELKLGRKVAVKALSIANLQDETVKRFEREAQVMGKLDHPNIVTLYAVGRHRDVPFLVMRYLEGGSLWDLLDANGGRLTPEQLLPLVKQLCSALGYIHGKNLIHRDLKPSNIFISPQGKVTLLDLGLARGHTTALTGTGIIWGTPDFMAPEQIVGEKQLDGRADLYALGVVLYRMISNQPPFPDEDEQDLMRAHLTRPRPDISKVWFGASPALSLVLQKAMAIKPEDRYQTAEELAQAFERTVSSREQSTRAGAAVPAAPPSKPVALVGSAPTAGMKPPAAAPPSVPANKPAPAVPGAPAPAAASPTPNKPVPATLAPPAAAPPAAVAKPIVGPVTIPPPRPSSPSMRAVTTLPAAPATAPPPQASVKGKVIDELDDDRTEAGELSPELMALITGSPGSGDLTVPLTRPPAESLRKPPAPPPRVSAPAGPVPSEQSAAPNRRSGVTAYDRPPVRSLDAEPGESTVIDSSSRLALLTSPNLADVPRPVVPGEPDTGPSEVVDATVDLGQPMMMNTGDIEPDAEPHTDIGPLPADLDLPPEGATVVMVTDEQTRAMLPTKGSAPAAPPRMSAPRATGNQPRKSQQLPAQRPAQTRPDEVSGEESPPWMHPYVLITGGLLLLALGFLIGVLLR